ncbi:hypothetical protein AAF712_005101 [Marasmius tenuissimus]|uniref:Uncharacterized protein n=1 Tax=Marasmius tenuissimus TaxID=585030 RepID=A0ABR3A5W3_9AGAR
MTRRGVPVEFSVSFDQKGERQKQTATEKKERPFVTGGHSGGIWPIVIQVPRNIAQEVLDRLTLVVDQHYTIASPAALIEALQNDDEFLTVERMIMADPQATPYYWAMVTCKTVALYIEDQKEASTHSTWSGAFFAMVSKSRPPFYDLVVDTWAPVLPGPVPPSTPSSPSPSAFRGATPPSSRFLAAAGSPSPSKAPSKEKYVLRTVASPASASRGFSAPSVGPSRTAIRAARKPLRSADLSLNAIDYFPSHGYTQMDVDAIVSIFTENANDEIGFIESLTSHMSGVPADEAGYIHRMLFNRW